MNIDVRDYHWIQKLTRRRRQQLQRGFWMPCDTCEMAISRDTKLLLEIPIPYVPRINKGERAK